MICDLYILRVTLVVRLLYDALGVQIHSQIFQALNLQLEDFGTVKIFVLNGETFLEF